MNETKIACGNNVPGSLAQVGITMKYTLLDYVRSRRFFILLTIAIVISAIQKGFISILFDSIQDP